MEFVEGQTLAQILDRNRLARKRESEAGRRPRERGIVEGPDAGTPTYFAAVARAFAGAAEGLQAAHSKGVVHRDLKPSNLILEPATSESGDRLRILDFGLARLEGLQSLTISAALIGTPLYMSPEQARARRTPIDGRTDIYSLGATLFEVLAGRPPFEGRDFQDTLSQILSREPPAPRSIDPRVPSALETIVLKCLEKEPADRYRTAEALAQDLHRFARGDPIEARPRGAGERLARMAWRFRGRIALAASLLSALLLGGYLYHEKREQAAALAARQFRDLLTEAAMRVELASAGDWDVVPRSGIDEATAQTLAAETREILERAERLEGTRAESAYLLARSHEVAGDRAAARRSLESALARDAHYAPALALREVIEAPGGLGAVEPQRSPPAVAPDWSAPLRASQEGRHADAARAYGALLAARRNAGTADLGLDIELRLGRGRSLFKAQDFQGALLEFAACEALWPESPVPTLLLAKTLWQSGDHPAADLRLQEVHDRAPANARDSVAGLIALVYHDLKAYQQAMAWTEAMGDCLERQERIGHLHFHLGGAKDSVRELTAVLEERPGWTTARLHRGMAWREAGDMKGAQADLEAAVKAEPSCWAAWFHLAQVRRTQGDISGARAACDRGLAIKVDPALLSERSVAKLSTGDLEGAWEDNEWALRFGPDDLYLMRRGTIQRRRGQLNGALASFQAALEIKKTPDLYLNRGTLRFQQRDFSAAIADFRQMLSLDPRLEEANIHLRFALLCRADPEKDLDGAIADCREIISLEPPHTLIFYDLPNGKRLTGPRERLMGLVLLLEKRGMERYNRKDYLGALADLDEVLSIQGPLWSTLNTRALILEKLGELEAASRDAGHSVELNPDFLSARLLHGNLLVKRGYLLEGLEQYERALAQERPRPPPELRVDVPALLYRAMARAEMDPEGAIADAEAGLKVCGTGADLAAYVHAQAIVAARRSAPGSEKLLFGGLSAPRAVELLQETRLTGKRDPDLLRGDDLALLREALGEEPGFEEFLRQAALDEVGNPAEPGNPAP